MKLITNDVKKMELEVLPKVKAWISKQRHDLNTFHEPSAEDNKWVQNHITELLNDLYIFSDFVANTYEKHGAYPDLKGLRVSEIADLMSHDYLEQCMEEEDNAQLQYEIHGY